MKKKALILVEVLSL